MFRCSCAWSNPSSPEAVVENAIYRMMEDEVFTDDDRRAIAAADRQIACGETVDFDQFAEQMRRKVKSM